MKLFLLTSLRPELVKIWVCQESSPGGSLLPPADLASIAASARNVGVDVKLLELRTPNGEKILSEALLESPDAVILNLTTTSAQSDYELLQKIPSHVIKLVFGTHAQSNPEECFANGIHGVLVGDPEAIIVKLFENKMDLEKTPGISTPQAKKAAHNAESLDALPFPALDLLTLDAYHAPYIRNGKRFAILMSSRGCPFKCTYCLYPFLFGATARSRSAKNIVDEMEFDCRNFKIEDFYFLDATFNLSKERIIEICQELIARKLPLSWICNMRVSPVDENLLSIMKQAGCRWIYYGVEDQDLLRETKKGTSTNATTEAFRLTKRAGIQTMAFLMVFPREDLDERGYVEHVFRTINHLDADAFQCNVAIPFPGTPLFKEYSERFPNFSQDWNRFDPHGKKLPYETNLNLIEVKKRIYRRFFFMHPGKVAKIAFQMGPKALVKQARAFLSENFG